MFKSWRIVTALFVLNLSLSSVYGQDAASQSAAGHEDFAQLAESAKGSIAPPTEQTVSQAIAELRASADRLSRYLTGSNGEAWKRYLKWDRLEEQLGAGSMADPAALQEVRRQFVANHVGLEMPVFADVLRTLDRAIIALEASKAENFSGAVSSQIDELAKNLTTYADSPAEEQASAIGTTVGWLDRLGQARPLVQAVRSKYRMPNLFVRTSERMVGAGIERPVDDIGPIHDNILGTDVHGTARTVGRVSVELVPSKQRALISTVLSGTTYSNTVGYNGPATICSQGNTCIYGSKVLAMDRNGLVGLPPIADARTSTTITGVSAGGPGVFGRVIQKVATKQVYKNKSAAEAEASRKAEIRVRNRVEEEAVGSIADANRDYANRFRQPLIRWQAFPELLHFQTSDQYLYVTATQATSSQLGAPNWPPVLEGRSDLAVQLHETVANNVAAAFLSGRTLTQEELNKRLIEIYGELPPEMQADEDEEPWSITFADSRPVTLVLNDNGLRVTIRGKAFTSGEREFKAMNITADYKVEVTETGARFTRQGDIAIFPPGFVEGQDRFSTAQTALRSILRRKFGKLFKEEAVSDGIELKGRLATAGKLKPTRFVSNGGWLLVQWVLPEARQSAPVPASNVTAAK